MPGEKPPYRPIRHVLVANRGEIACRIARAARERGAKVTTLYTPEESAYPQRFVGDHAINLGHGPLAATYLDMDRLIAFAKEQGCDAIHPGYGFLSERAEFAARCERAGILFIGPKSEQIAMMGDKARAKQIAQVAGVPVIPGSEEGTLKEAERIGFPILIKATAGGGGKGMRVVENAEAFVESLAACQREAMAAFGSDDVILEKYLRKPRHIEIQVAADLHGNAVYIGERECSIQRRHQKIIEESPSPAVSDDLRERMGGYALSLVKHMGYTNLGTLEFLVDDQENVYFLEMNTRLQVEHTVTEERYAIDLVQIQFDLAEGKSLSFAQADLVPRRYALECRLCAEDPDNHFLPSIGMLHRLRLPSAPGVRFDMGIAEGNEVGIQFDPMLGKLITYGDTRAQAIRRAINALRETVCFGVKTNFNFLIRLLETDAFQSGDLNIHLLETLDLKTPSSELPEAVQRLLAHVQEDHAAKPMLQRKQGPWDHHSGWRVLHVGGKS